MSSFRACWLTIVLVALASLPAAGQGVLYVDDDAPPGGDGLTWITAYQHLQDALAAAGASGGQVSEIRIGQGTYRPDQGQGQTPGSRAATFQLLEDLCIKGGFAGLGAADPDQRDIRTFETVLDGANVSYHVVTGSGTDGTAILDGVAIQGGNADGTSGYLNKGGGMLNIDGSPRIINCFFRSNYAADRGGGMYNENYSEPKLVNTIFSGNRAKNGAAVYNYIASDPVLVNCTVAKNRATLYAGGIYSSGSSIPNLHNCIVADNMDKYGYWDMVSQIRTEGMAVVSHSFITGLTSAMLHPGNIGGPWSDPGFAGSDYQLLPSSPCVDRGDNSALPSDASDLDGDGDTAEPIPFDRGNVPRAFNCLVDMGAYEAVTDLPSPIRTDFDGDCDVDAEDLQLFAACGTGPAMPYTDPNCAFADLDADADIDQTDFGLFQGCFSGSGWLADPDCLPPTVPTLADYSNTCVDISSNCDPDYVELIPSDGTLRIIHHNALYNCCVSDIHVGLFNNGRTLVLTETDVIVTPCTCVCCYDVEATVVGLQKEAYTVTVYGRNNNGQRTSHTMDVEIP